MLFKDRDLLFMIPCETDRTHDWMIGIPGAREGGGGSTHMFDLTGCAAQQGVLF